MTTSSAYRPLIKSSLIVACQLNTKSSGLIDDFKEELPQNLKKISRKIKKGYTRTNDVEYSRDAVSFIATISEMSAVGLIKYDLINKDGEIQNKQAPYQLITLRTPSGTFIEVAPILTNKSIQYIGQLREEGLLSVSGIYTHIPLNKEKSKFIFVITNIEKIPSIQSYLAISPHVDQMAEEFIGKKQLKKRILEELVTLLSIKGLDKSQKLKMALQFCILQAVSGGYQIQTSGKLNMLIIGAPGSGKKLLSAAGKILNPTFQSITSGKMSKAGLSASANNNKKKWISEPKAIVLANEGLMSWEDFHNTPKSDIEPAVNIMGGVMENGYFIDSTSSNQKFKAITGLLIDLNKKSHLGNQRVNDYLDDIHNLPENFISRFEFITEIEEDPERQLSIAIDMIHELGCAPVDNKEERILILKTVIAKIRDNFPQVYFSNEVRQQIARYHEELFLKIDNQDLNKKSGSYQTRTINSEFKIISSLARLAQRGHATIKDVELAFNYIQEKFTIINRINPNSTSTNRITGSVPSRREINTWLINTFKQAVFNAKDASLKYHDHFDTDQSETAVTRTIYRVLKSNAIKVGHNRYRFNLSK